MKDYKKTVIVSEYNCSRVKVCRLTVAMTIVTIRIDCIPKVNDSRQMFNVRCAIKVVIGLHHPAILNVSVII